MKVLGHLYKILNDHTKDAAMLLDYAEELKNEMNNGNKTKID